MTVLMLLLVAMSGRSHSLGVGLLHHSDIAHHLKAGAVAQDVLWCDRPLFGLKIDLDLFVGGDQKELLLLRRVHLQNRQIDMRLIGTDLAAAIQQTAFHQCLSHALPKFSPDPQTTGLFRHWERNRAAVY